MGRWEPNAVQRLQESAMELFCDRGYVEVTVADIAERAGLTKRTFFNHFADKREVLFAAAEQFQASVIGYLDEVADGVEPIDAAMAALTRGGVDLTSYGESAHARRALIASSTELQERNLTKMGSLAAALEAGLHKRGAPSAITNFAAQAAVAVFAAAYDEWSDNTTLDFPGLMQKSLSHLRRAIGCKDTDR